MVLGRRHTGTAMRPHNLPLMLIEKQLTAIEHGHLIESSRD